MRQFKENGTVLYGEKGSKTIQKANTRLGYSAGKQRALSLVRSEGPEGQPGRPKLRQLPEQSAGMAGCRGKRGSSSAPRSHTRGVGLSDSKGRKTNTHNTHTCVDISSH